MLKQYTLTLDGNAQRLSSVFTNTDVPNNEDVLCQSIMLQPDGANNNPILVGDENVAAAAFCFRLEAGNASNEPPAPFILGDLGRSGARLSDFYVLGTNLEVLHIGIVT